MKRLASMMTGRHGRGVHGAAAALLATTMLLGLALCTGCGSDEADVTFPTQPQPPSMRWLFDVFGTSANNVYIGGNDGVAFRWDGTAWTPVDLNTDRAITCIWGPGDGTLYLSGHGGLIMRNTGGGWSSMSSGTTNDLYALGSYQGQVHAVGYGGAARRLAGGAWQNIPSIAVIRNPQAGNAPSDTLDLNLDVESLLTVNHYFLGGAYRLPGWRETDMGRTNTDGMVLTADSPPPTLPGFDWQLRPLRGDQLALYEWIYCTTSDDATLSNNYLGTSEGWLFQLVEDENNPGKLIWSKFNTRITADRNTGIRDMWLAANGDLYMVTDGGRIVYRAVDGTTRELYNQLNSLVGIWGASPAEFWVTGYMDQTILRCSYDPVGDVFTSTPVTLAFPQ